MTSNTIYRLFQDRNGYIWFTSDEGLFRWDGLNIKAYTNKEQRGSGMNSILQAPNGRIWVCNFVGQIFYIRNDSLIRLPSTDNTPELYACNAIYFNSQGQLGFSSNCGRAWFYHNSEWQAFKGAKYTGAIGNINNKTWLVSCDIVNNKAKVYFVDNEKKDSVVFDCKGSESIVGESFAGTVIDNELWLAPRTRKNLYCIDGNKNVRMVYLEDAPSQVALFKSFTNKQGIRTLWISSTDGAREYSTDGKLLQHLLAGQFVTDIIKDRDDNLWFGTRGNGIYQLAAQSVLLYNAGTKHFVSDNLGHIALDNNGDLLITHTTSLVTRFNPLTGKTQSTEFGKGNELNGTFRLSNGKYFTYGNSNLIYNSPQNIVSENLGAIKNILEVKPNVILLAGSANMGVLFLNNDKIPRLNADDIEPSKDKHAVFGQYTLRSLRPTRTWCFERDANPDLVWIAFADELMLWDSDKMTSQVIKDDSGGSIHARDLSLAPDGSLWVSTSDNGIFQLIDKKVQKHFNQDNSIISNYCRHISTNSEGVAVTTGQGLFLIRTQNLAIERLDKADGLPTNDLMDVMLLNQDIWVTSPKGLLRLPLNEKWNNPVPPEIQLIDIAVFEKKIPIIENRVFEYNENNIRFDFCATSWRAPDKLSYRYRLLGAPDTSWTQVTSRQQSVRYSALSAGFYTFEVFATNEDGVKSTVIRYTFSINKPFWQKWWFYALCLIGIVAVISIYYNIIINRLHRSTLLEQEKVALALAKSQTEELLRSSQLSSLKAQMNPHFIFNALNSLQSFILHNNALKANIYLTDFAQLMRLTLEMSNKTAISLQEELDLLQLYLQLEGVRFGDTFHYDIEVLDDIDTYEVQIPSMLIQPYVENAIKHGLLHRENNRRLKVMFELTEEGDVLSVKIQDNGVGRAFANELKSKRSLREKHLSFSTSATQERLNILNHGRTRLLNVVYEDLFDDEGRAAGTAVTIFIPI